jgi:NADH dehydrogenase
VATTIFRPSVVFGADDHFLNLFAEFERLFPMMFLPSPQARFQPVYVQDVASAIVAALLNPQACGATYPLCGSVVYTLAELVEYVGRVTGHHRPVMGLSPAMSEMQARMMELSPLKLLTLDNIRSMKVDSVCDQPLPFGLRATSLEAVAPSWLTSGPRKRFSFFRSRAGR